MWLYTADPSTGNALACFSLLKKTPFAHPLDPINYQCSEQPTLIPLVEFMILSSPLLHLVHTSIIIPIKPNSSTYL